jgi:DNA-binding NtrC family response regulator
MERLHIVRALDYTGGKKAPAARMLGIDVKTLSNKIKSYRIEL